uniref:Cytochrome C biogenesis protein transmembrane domain-containing protein n=1 Tax=candidate division WWE3 bacterium TaxID=2053526 RepID=A0A7C4XHH5_UNCKA
MLFENLVNVLDAANVSIWVAFAAGFITFFATCLLHLIATYLVYISGLSYSEVKNASGNRRKKVVFNSITFTVGFILVFVILGIIGNRLYSQITPYKRSLEIFIGILFILIGLNNFNTSFIKGFKWQSSFNLREFLKKLNFLPKSIAWSPRGTLINSFLVGLGFGMAWTPCIGPVLGIILYWASQTETLAKGIYYLTAFGVGLGLPFVLIAAGGQVLLERIGKIKSFQKIVGLISLIIGIGLIF